MNSVLWTIVHGIDPAVCPIERGSWTIVHGIYCRVWPTESVSWTIVHVIDRRL